MTVLVSKCIKVLLIVHEQSVVSPNLISSTVDVPLHDDSPSSLTLASKWWHAFFVEYTPNRAESTRTLFLTRSARMLANKLLLHMRTVHDINFAMRNKNNNHYLYIYNNNILDFNIRFCWPVQNIYFNFRFYPCCKANSFRKFRSGFPCSPAQTLPRMQLVSKDGVVSGKLLTLIYKLHAHLFFFW